MKKAFILFSLSITFESQALNNPTEKLRETNQNLRKANKNLRKANKNPREINQALQIINPTFDEQAFKETLRKIKNKEVPLVATSSNILNMSKQEEQEIITNLITENKVNTGMSRKLKSAGFYNNGTKYITGPISESPDDYPFAICLNESNLTENEKELMQNGMYIWNKKYQDYYERQPNQDKPNLPQNLFTESCDYSNHLVIQVRAMDTMHKKHYGSYMSIRLPYKTNNQRSFGVAGDFIGLLKINSDFLMTAEANRKLKVITHELGHVIGFPLHPHVPPEISELMSEGQSGTPLSDRHLADSDIEFLMEKIKVVFNHKKS